MRRRGLAAVPVLLAALALGAPAAQADALKMYRVTVDEDRRARRPRPRPCYTWWQEPVYGFNYPPNQEGDDDRPHMAFFRELDISNDWSQWWLGIGARQGGVGSVKGPPTTPPTPTVAWTPETLVPSGLHRRHGADHAQHGRGRRRHDRAHAGSAVTGLPDPRAKTPTRLRSISSVTLQRPFRQERIEVDYAGAPAGNGGAIISTRDAVSIGFGLEQITDGTVRNELVRRMMTHPLPTGADTAAPTLTWLRPGDGATVNGADPVEIEVETVDERGDVNEVRLSVGGQLVQRKVPFPFQMRWYPSAADVGRTVTLALEAEDKAGTATSPPRHGRSR